MEQAENIQEEAEYEVEKILYFKISEYFVKWSGYDITECSWEPRENFGEGSKELLEEFDKNPKELDTTPFKKIILLAFEERSTEENPSVNDVLKCIEENCLNEVKLINSDWKLPVIATLKWEFNVIGTNPSGIQLFSIDKSPLSQKKKRKKTKNTKEKKKKSPKVSNQVQKQTENQSIPIIQQISAPPIVSQPITILSEPPAIIIPNPSPVVVSPLFSSNNINNSTNEKMKLLQRVTSQLTQPTSLLSIVGKKDSNNQSSSNFNLNTESHNSAVIETSNNNTEYDNTVIEVIEEGSLSNLEEERKTEEVHQTPKTPISGLLAQIQNQTLKSQVSHYEEEVPVLLKRQKELESKLAKKKTQIHDLKQKAKILDGKIVANNLQELNILEAKLIAALAAVRGKKIEVSARLSHSSI